MWLFVSLDVGTTGDMYGPATFYCWIGNKKYYFVSLYLWVLLAIIYVCVVLVITHVYVSKRAHRQGNLDALESSSLITLKLRIYMVAFVLLWSPSAIYRSEYRGALAQHTRKPQ